ncbi:hypothetical protein HYV50_06070 [Candidatus Pacearchaeota archaeon]|nr:hypothetical protein [Candidatus Pacearchaeota archaeon]
MTGESLKGIGSLIAGFAVYLGIPLRTELIVQKYQGTEGVRLEYDNTLYFVKNYDNRIEVGHNGLLVTEVLIDKDKNGKVDLKKDFVYPLRRAPLILTRMDVSAWDQTIYEQAVEKYNEKKRENLER